MKLWKYFVIAGLFLVSITIFGANPVFALNVNDSPQWKTSNNYAMIPVRVDCSAYGGNSANDGICDNWKNNPSNPGLHINFTDRTQGTTSTQYRYDLSCVPGNTIANDPTGLTVCPSTNKPDVYVELDYMTGQGPSMQAIADVVKAFDSHNVALHIQLGENSNNSNILGDIGLHYCFVNWGLLKNTGTANQACYSTSTNSQSYPWLKQNFFGTIAERSGDPNSCPLNNVPTNYLSAGPVSNKNSYNCLTAKRQAFHYGMFVNYQVAGVANSGLSEINGNDFVVSLGNFENSGIGTIDEQEADFMHELGHNFGLGHGGLTSSGTADSNNNCKPNYPSIMSYTYLFRKTADVCRPLDFSSSKLSDLNEGALQDSNVGNYTYPSPIANPPDNSTSCQSLAGAPRSIYWSNGATTVSGTAGSVMDWDQNGLDSNTYSQVLNNLPPQCSATSTTTLTGTDDWSYIKNGNSASPTPLNFRPSSNFWQKQPAANNDNDVAVDAHIDTPPTTSWIITCTPPQVQDPNTGQCVNPSPVCMSPLVKDPNTGQCVNPPPVCMPPQVLDPQTKTCINPPDGLVEAIAIAIGAIAVVTSAGLYSARRKR